MKTKFILPALAALAITATQSTAATGISQITSADVFGEIVVGKTLSRNASSFTIQPDGTISGTYGGRDMTGTWEWVGDAFCRTLTSPRRGYSCQMVKTDGDAAFFSRYPGNGMPMVQEAIARSN